MKLNVVSREGLFPRDLRILFQKTGASNMSNRRCSAFLVLCSVLLVAPKCHTVVVVGDKKKKKKKRQTEREAGKVRKISLQIGPALAKKTRLFF